MQVKAIIMRPDRTNDYVVVSKRNLQGKTFRYDNETYILQPDRFQVTWTRPGWALGLVRRYFTTYYYTKGNPNPLPVPDFKNVKLEDGTQDYSQVVNNGISAEELAAIFNPWFYRVIAAQSMSIWEQIQLLLTVGIALGLVYVIYALSTGNYALPPGISP